MRANLGPKREVVSCIAWADLARVSGVRANVQTSVAEAANWRISEFMSCTAWRTCAPDQLSVRVRYASVLRTRARSSAAPSELCFGETAEAPGGGERGDPAVAGRGACDFPNVAERPFVWEAPGLMSAELRLG